MLNAAFYTEAGTQKGMGHLIRSYTIYETFKQNGINSKFFLDSDTNFSYKFKDIIPFSWKKFNIDSNYDIIVIDSYVVTEEIYLAASKRSKLIVSIDDYGRLQYPKGIIINFAPDAKELFYKEKKEGYHYLLGLNYIPIRKEFLSQKIEKKEQIFVMLGGSDVNNLSKNILSSIESINLPKVIVVNNENIPKELERFHHTKVMYKPKDKELIQAMSSSSIAISTASMTLYELSFFNIPTMIIALNHNQKVGASQSIKHNLAEKLLELEKNDWEKDLRNFIQTKMISNNEKKIQTIDGKGTQRILDKVKEVVRL